MGIVYSCGYQPSFFNEFPLQIWWNFDGLLELQLLITKILVWGYLNEKGVYKFIHNVNFFYENAEFHCQNNDFPLLDLL